jgi:hypothetical protein
MKKAGNFDNHMNAEIAKGLLKQYDIKSVIEANDGGGALPHLATKGAEIFVHDKNLERAREILKTIEGDAQCVYFCALLR